MNHLAFFGLGLALLGPLALQACVRGLGVEPFRPGSRAVLWALAVAVLLLAALSLPDWREPMGLRAADGFSLGAALLATVCILVSWPLLQWAQARLGARDAPRSQAFQQLAQMSLRYRVFLVLTAAVTEELLFRGYGIGVGALLLNNLPVAFALSLLLFVAAHFRWGWAHVLPVLWAGAVLSALFVITGSLLACMLAHALVDAVGLLLAPRLMALKAARGETAAGA